jgi:3-deoxy-D-manno-octulosonic acid (KDO) 8-phosphate synthase
LKRFAELRIGSLSLIDQIHSAFRGSDIAPSITAADVHHPVEASPLAKVCDIIQLPTFLAQQTELVEAIALTGGVINIKKPESLSSSQSSSVVEKPRKFSNMQLLIGERAAISVIKTL